MDAAVDILSGKGAEEMQGNDHPHVLEVRRELHYENGNWRHILIVITDLPIDPQDEGHDANGLNKVIQHVANEAIKAKNGYNGIVVRNP